MGRGEGFGSVTPITKEQCVNGVTKTRITGYTIRYTGPDRRRYREPWFKTKTEAGDRLAVIRGEINAGTWKSPEQIKAEKAAAALKAHTVGTWSEAYLKMPGKRGPRKQRTLQDYRYYLDRFILPDFKDVRLVDVTIPMATTWLSNLCPDNPCQRTNVSMFFAGMMKTAATQRLIPFTPCVFPGMSAKQRQGETVLPEGNDVILASGFMPEKYELMPLIAGWVGLREAEVLALSRQQVDTDRRLIRVMQASERYDGVEHLGTTKTRMARSVPIRAEWLVDRLKKHLDENVPNRPDALLFPNPKTGGLLSRYTLWEWWDQARDKVGISNVRFYDLRHLYASMRAEMGATGWELMEEMGQQSLGVLAKYIGRTPERVAKTIVEQLPVPSLISGDVEDITEREDAL